MQTNESQTSCQHDGCECTIEPDKEFCSSYCRDASRNGGAVGEEMQDACGCGHPECDQA